LLACTVGSHLPMQTATTRVTHRGHHRTLPRSGLVLLVLTALPGYAVGPDGCASSRTATSGRRPAVCYPSSLPSFVCPIAARGAATRPLLNRIVTGLPKSPPCELKPRQGLHPDGVRTGRRW